MSGARGRAARRIAGNLALAAGSVLVFFGLAETALRATGLAPSRALRSPDLATLEEIPGIYAPGQEFVDRVRRDLPARIRINNLGFRGRDLSERKRPGALRVLVLGDSYTFGDHVDTEEAWPARLEAALGDGEEIEVINAGANGFGILDERKLWEKAGRRLDPDIVVLTFSANDVSDLTRPVPMIDQMRSSAALKSRRILGPALRLLQDTAVFNGMQILRARMRVLLGGHDALPGIEPARAGPALAPAIWESYRGELHLLGALLAVEGRRSLLVLYPSWPHVEGTELFHGGAVLPAWAAETGMECLDLLPALREAARSGEKLYLVPRDSHPGPAAHAVAAAAVARELGRLGWLEGAGTR